MGLPLAGLVALCLALTSARGTEMHREGRTRNHGHSVCSTWGDFHYKTFDGDVFRFPGLCDYNLASDCRGSYKEFAVHLRRGPGRDGSHPEIQYILLTVKDDVLYLTRQLVVVNGAMVSTPHYSSGLLIEKNDAYTKVFSRAGLSLMWNREDSLMLELDSKFRNLTCGLCGDYNGQQTYSEFLSDGLPFTATEFGNMQKISKPDVVCDDPEDTPAPQSCSEHRAECERLLGAAAFAECLGLLPLELYVRACMQDRCQCPPGASCACSTLAEFSRQCSHAGGRPGNWRTATLCPKSCPGNMVYLESGSPCVDTCSHPEVGSLCEEHRMDGCFCPEGTVYDDVAGSGCIPVSQCQCKLQGHLYAPGQQVTHDCEHCVCNAGRWVCKDLPCPGTCALEGGSHITTFDGKKYTFHGDCYYVLAKGDHNDSYALLGEMAPCGPTDKQTCLKTVVLLADRKKNVVAFKSDGSVLLNELQVNLPHVTASFSIFQPSSYHLVVTTAFGLRMQVQLTPVMQLFLTLDQAYQGHVQGLCGNFNGREGDDFRTAGGLVEATGAGFANTWKAQASCQDKLEWLDDPCSLNIESANYAEHWCSLLKKTGSPFGRCHSAVDPAEYYKRCKYDTCNCQNTEDCLCAALSSYARACAAQGVLLSGWRDPVCNKDVGSCPKSQVFLYNLTTCQQTCRSLSEPDSHCLQGFAPVDGCGCPEHTFLDEKGRCVPLAKCSCYHRGLYLEAGQVVLRQEERCVCRNGRLHCIQVKLIGQSCRAPKILVDCNNLTALAIRNPRPVSCQTLATGYYQTECISGCVCPEGLIDDGRGGCVAEEECPCMHNKDLYDPGEKIKVNCNTCTCRRGHWACTQSSCHGTCTIYGSGHYITFDGKYYDFDGHCSYVAAQDYCGQNSSLGSFSIITENVPCGTTGVTCSKAIKIFMGRTELKLEDKHRMVIHRDEGQHVAYTTREVGQYLVVETSTGIIVIWDKKTTIFIKLAPSYQGTVCGLCGNFDQRSNNDFTTRDNIVVQSELDFGNSWKEAPTCPDVTTTPEPCTKNPHRRAWAEKQCSIIKSPVFSVCHSKVDPKPFYEACVHDSCSCDTGGDCECFCSAVASYAQECTKEGACVFWRTPDLCPIFCDYYNPPDECEWHYEPCGNRSFETCRTVNGIHSNVSVSYLEGCYPRCPEDRPIYDEDQKKCVTKDQCGCYVEDTHYPPGASIPSQNICQSCVCANSSQVCQPEEGKILNFTQDGAFCYWEVCGPNGTVEKHFNICISTPTPSSSPTPATPTPTTPTTTATTTTQTPSTVSPSSPTTPKLCCFWSDWINEDRPDVGSDNGDQETFDHVCKAPEDIQCRSAEDPHLSWEELGQKAQCNISFGFICKNEDQFGHGPFEVCYDYEIRVNCCLPLDECPTTPTSRPPTTTANSTPTPTTSPTPTPEPTTTVTTTTTTPTATPETTMTVTTTVTTTVPMPTPCVDNCKWMGWLDSGKPNFTKPGGDVESIEKVCEPGWAANISCRAAMFPNVPIEQLGQTVVCDLSVGLVCRNQDQKPGGVTPQPFCLNYEINVQCCQPCVPTSPVTTTTMETPTPIITTTTETPTPTPIITTTTEIPTPTPIVTTTTETPTPTPIVTTTEITPTPIITTTTKTPTPTPIVTTTETPTSTPITTTSTETPTPTTTPIISTETPTPTPITTTTTETPTPTPTTTETPTSTPITTTTTTTTETPTPTTTPIISTETPTPTPIITTTTTETPTPTPTTTETPTSTPITTTTTTTETPTPTTTPIISTETPTPTPITTTTTTETLTPTPTTTVTPTTTPTISTETPTPTPIVTTTTTETPTPTPIITTTTEIPTPTPITTTEISTPTPIITTTTTETPTPTTTPIISTETPTPTPIVTTTTTEIPTPTPTTTVTPTTTPTISSETPTPTPIVTTTTTETPTPTPIVTTTTTITEISTTPTTSPTPTPEPTTMVTTTTTTPTATPETTTTVTTTVPMPTPCVDNCKWTGWLDSGKPNFTKPGGDVESIEKVCEPGWAANISCRAAMFPNVPIEQLGQTVVCDLSVGLVCRNQDQKPGGVTPQPFCLNYEINVQCCQPCVPTSPVTTTTMETPTPTPIITTTTETPTPTPIITTTTEIPTPTPIITTTTKTPTPTPIVTTTETPTSTPITTTTTETPTPTTTPIISTETPTPTPIITTTTTETSTPTPTTTETPTSTPITTTTTTTETPTPTTTPIISTETPTPTPIVTTTETPTSTPITTTTTTTTETPTPTTTVIPTTTPTISTETPTPTPIVTTTTETPTPTPIVTTTTTETPTPTPIITTTETPTSTPITTTTTTTETPTPTTTPIISTETPTPTPIVTTTTTETPTPTTTVTPTTTPTISSETPTPTPIVTTTTTETPTPTPIVTSTEIPTSTPITTTTTTTETPTPTTTPIISTETPTLTPIVTTTTTETPTPTTTVAPTTTPTISSETSTPTPIVTTTETPTSTPITTTTTETPTPTTTPIISTETPTPTPIVTTTTTETPTPTPTTTVTPTTTPTISSETPTPIITTTETPTSTPITTTTTTTETPTPTPTVTSTETPTSTPITTTTTTTTTETPTPTTTPTISSETSTPIPIVTTTTTETPTPTPIVTSTEIPTSTPITTTTTTTTETPAPTTTPIISTETPTPTPITTTTTETPTPTPTTTVTPTTTPTISSETPTPTPIITTTETPTSTPITTTTTTTETPTSTTTPTISTETPTPTPIVTTTTTETPTPTTTPTISSETPTPTPIVTTTETPTSTPITTTTTTETPTPTTTPTISTEAPTPTPIITTTTTETPTPTPTTTTSTETPTPTTTIPVHETTTPEPSRTTSPVGSTTLLTTPPATPETASTPPSSTGTPGVTTTGGTTPSPPVPSTTTPGPQTTGPPSTPTTTTTTGTPTPTGRPSTTSPASTVTPISTPGTSGHTSPSFSGSTIIICCVVNETYFGPGETVYNGTHGDTCYFVNCSLSCTLEFFNWSCPSTPVPTPTPTRPMSSSTPMTTRPPATTSHSTAASKPPGCPDFDPPRQENETWWLCNCTKAVCKHDHVVELVPVECTPPPMPTCSNNLTPVRVPDPDGCCWHWECDCHCTGWGDPHYVTFDGLYYSYQGNCTYVLVEEVRPSVDNFGVYIDNYHCDVTDRVSCPRTLIVRHETQEVQIKTVHMAPMKVQVQVNRQAVALPYKKYGLQVYESGINYVVDIPELGALISYNGLSFSIRLPYHRFGNNTKGQCGTCTNSTADDCVLPSGEVVSDCEVAADQWVVNDPSKPHCPHTSVTTKRPATTLPGGGSTPGKDCASPLCELIKDSLFAQCHALVPPQHYYEACVFDSCFVPESGMECASLQTYAALCAQEGACVDWRNHTHGACPVMCPAHREYRACGPADEPTCKSSSPENNTRLVEGCFCPEGTMNYAPGFDVCVDLCGCVGPDNVPREFGEHFEFDCKDCACLEGGSGIVCQPKKCSQKGPSKCTEDGTYLVVEVDPKDTCCNITSCKCNTSLCKEKPPMCPLGFDMKSELLPGRCCPFYSCVPKGVCVLENAEYQPGSPVYSSKCQRCFCTNTTDSTTHLNLVSCSHVPCNTSCSPGFQLVEAPGECCSKCQQTQCIISRPDGHTLVLKPGDIKSDPKDHCTFFSCVKIHNQLISSVSNITCPDFDPSACVLGSITLMPNGCCKKCILRNETRIPCSTIPMSKEISDAGCTARVTMNYCSGSCGTFAMYSAEAQGLDHKCSCCKEEHTTQRQVQLSCPDGSSRSHTYTHIESCLCQDTTCELLPAQLQAPGQARLSRARALRSGRG